MSYVEFLSSHDAAAFLNAAKTKQMKVASKIILIKPAKSRVNLSRDWALRKAGELVKSHSGRDAKIDFKGRTVSVGDVVVFEQTASELEGTFKGEFSRLRLP